MYNYVDNGWSKTFLKQLIKILLCFTLIYTPFFAYAGAAEKWEYEPVMKDMNIHVKGYKVDQYGNAVNDNQYITKIDPKTTSNKQKMGTVGMGRLLKSTGWGLLGAAALEGLLEAVDWVIDPEAQSIWRNKPKNGATSPPQNFGCSMIKTVGTDTYALKFLDQQGTEYNCAIDAAKAIINKIVSEQSFIYSSGKFLRWHDPSLDPNQPDFRFYANFTLNDGRVSSEVWYTVVPSLGEKLTPQEPEIEVMTPETLADYVNKTHPDYSKPELAEKLNPKHSPEIVEDLWKPSNEWEETNSPTAKEVVRQLEQSNPTSQDKDIEQKTDEDGNPTGSFSLPDFCSWATPVCDFIKWVKDNPDNEEEAPDTPQEIDIGSLDTSTFQATAGCPAPIQVPVNFGSGGNIEISYEPICQFAEKWSFVAPLIGFLSGAMILVGVGRKGEDGEI